MPALMQPLEHFLDILDVLYLGFFSDENVVKIAYDPWKPLQYGIHNPLKHNGNKAYKAQSRRGIAIPHVVSFDRQLLPRNRYRLALVSAASIP
jgi:hypothetical protein